MTGLGRWTFLPALAGLIVGQLRGQTGLAVVSLTVLLWIVFEWAWFTWRVWFEFPQLRFERLVNGRSESGGLLWAGRIVTVEVRISAGRRRLSPRLRITDVLPENMMVEDTNNDARFHTRFRAAVYRYEARISGAGRIRLPGFRVILQDPAGFFRAERFVPAVQIFRVLPAYSDVGEHQPSVKRINSLPQHGVHRLQRSGMGSELLELREYVPGDPPKSIAWKVSARRDKLMTRQYESEVPVRLNLFLDGCISTRLGGFGQRLLDQLTYVGASVARTAISVGDPVGAWMFDERGLRRFSPMAGERGFHRLLESMADFCVNPAPLPDRLTPVLQKTALSVLAEQFPELLDLRYNQLPFTWFPIFPWTRRRFRDRMLLSGALAELYQLSLAKHVQLIHDDALLATFAQHFLSQTGLAWLTPVVSVRGRGFHDGLPRMEMLSKAMTTAVATARDNEVFVILADLLESAHSISHLMPALKLARGKHHRVMVVCPTPSFRRPTDASTQIVSTSPEDLLLAAEQTRTRELATKLRRELRRLGVTLSFSGEQNAIRAVLSEMELARTGRLSTGVRS
ncbi:MAG: hypothetical protein RLZZ536_537 [Planctomycetota bacterium]|jgi:uncharacterized protein (DUF58 family)